MKGFIHLIFNFADTTLQLCSLRHMDDDSLIIEMLYPNVCIGEVCSKDRMFKVDQGHLFFRQFAFSQKTGAQEWNYYKMGGQIDR